MKTWTTWLLLGAMAAVAVVGTVVGSSLTRAPAGWDITEPGSPLYVTAVNESVKGLNKNQADESAKGEVCPDCGKVHAPVGGTQPNAANPAGGGVSTNFYYCDNCKAYHANPKPGDDQNPPHPVDAAGNVSTNVYYCDNCKTYHAGPRPAENAVPHLLQPDADRPAVDRAVELGLGAEAK